MISSSSFARLRNRHAIVAESADKKACMPATLWRPSKKLQCSRRFRNFQQGQAASDSARAFHHTVLAAAHESHTRWSFAQAQPSPQQAVASTKPRSAGPLPMENGQLMPEGQHLQFQGDATPKPEGDQGNYCREDRKHAGHDKTVGAKLQCLQNIRNYEQPQHNSLGALTPTEFAMLKRPEEQPPEEGHNNDRL